MTKKHAARAAGARHEPPADGTEGRNSAWKFLIAFTILVLLLVGMAAYSSFKRDRDEESNRYNGFDFAQAEGGLWVTRIEVGGQPYDIPFYHHPRDTESVVVQQGVTDTILKGAPRQIYISLHPDAGARPVIGAVEISRITGSKYNLLNIETKGALSEPAAGKVDIPVMSCKNATPDTVVVQFVQGSSNVISRSSNPSCIVLQYTDADESVRVADRFAYMLLRIM